MHARTSRSGLGDVVLLLSASRSGSSLVAEWLRRHSGATHLQGEFEVLLRRAGAVAKTPLRSQDSDADIDLSGGARDRVTALVEAGLGRPSLGERLDVEGYARAVHAALTVQWPRIEIDVEDIIGTTRRICTARGWRMAEQVDRWSYLLDLFAMLRARHPVLNPYCYDIPETVVASRFPELDPMLPPPDPDCDEDRPFIVPVPWQHRDNTGARPIVLKGPSCAHRIPAMRSLFGGRVRVLHLVRHPGGSINGLIDGWQHRAFQSRRLAEPLCLREAEQNVKLPREGWAPDWWCFDVPPGWAEYRTRSLAELCAFQWRSANGAILEQGGTDYHRMRFEDFLDLGAVGDATRRAALDWIRPGEGGSSAPLPPAQPVMATLRPAPDRWRERAALLDRVLVAPPLRRLANEVGYGCE